MNPPDESALDASIAGAMNRVLEAERAAEQAVSDCRAECDRALESAREQRLAILERASARITTLRARVSTALEELAAGASMPAGTHVSAAIPAAEPFANGTRQRSALDRLSARLTSGLPDERSDEP